MWLIWRRGLRVEGLAYRRDEMLDLRLLYCVSVNSYRLCANYCIVLSCLVACSSCPVVSLLLTSSFLRLSIAYTFNVILMFSLFQYIYWSKTFAPLVDTEI